jgi:hypothetical protein
MSPGEYGPFANTVAIAGALVATFGILMVKAIGRMKKWTWLVGENHAPGFLVAGSARILAVALMAVIYILITIQNHRWFGGVAVAFGVLGFYAVTRFDKLRKLYTHKVPLVAADGSQLKDKSGQPIYESLVIGSEGDMKPQAKKDYATAQKARGGLSITEFMSGYGSTKLNDPEAVWDRSTLVDNSSRLARSLMYIVLCAVLALFTAALVIEVASRR